MLVLRGCGPRGYPGMPEVANMPMPRKLVEAGVRDMVRVCDGRMSGTAYGTVVLHVSPEAAAGGPLALIRTGDMIVLDVAGRRLDVELSDDELAARTPAPADGRRLRRADARLGAALRQHRPAGRHRRGPRLPRGVERRRGLAGVALSARAELVAELERQLGDRVVTDPDRMSPWLRDQSAMTPVGTPAGVVRATSTDDVSRALRTASQHGVAVVTRGTGTGLSGGANALDGCLVLALEGLDQILDIDVDRRTATVQAGVVNADLGKAVAQHGLRYTPDPGSRDTSSIGGNIATNAGGMSCCKYGVTGDHVAGLTAVLASGEVIRTGGSTLKNVAGLDLTRLLVGSEGTLAVVVEATLRLRPAVEQESTVVAVFGSVEQAVRAVAVLTSRTTPSAVELLDRTTIGAVNAMTGMGIDEDAEAVLLITCDGPAAVREAEECESVAEANGATEVFRTDDADEGAELMNARRMALPALERLGSVLLDDVGVPVHLLPALVADIHRIAVERDVTIGTFGHAADGNLHPTVVYDASDPHERTRAEAAFVDILGAAVALGGTITGEHGVGSLKLPYVADMYGPTEVALMHRIKQAFDPDRLLNPGRAY